MDLSSLLHSVRNDAVPEFQFAFSDSYQHDMACCERRFCQLGHKIDFLLRFLLHGYNFPLVTGTSSGVGGIAGGGW